MENADLNQSALAKRLGRTRGHVSKILNGAHNMTLYTLGDMLWACDAEVRHLETVPLGVIEVSIEDAKDWEMVTTTVSPSRSPPFGADQSLDWPFLVESSSANYAIARTA